MAIRQCPRSDTCLRTCWQHPAASEGAGVERYAGTGGYILLQARVAEITVTENSPAAGRKLADVRWPPASIPVSVLQADSLHSADQGITLAVGDRVSLLLTATLRARRERLEELRAELGDTAQDYPVCVFLNTNVNPDERRAFDDAAAKWAQQSTRNISAEDLRDIGAIGTPTSAPPSSGRSPRPAPPTSSSSCCPLIRAASSG